MTATCPKCEGRLEKVADSAPDVWRAVLLCRCVDCAREWQITAAITAVGKESSCGTAAGYRKHHRRGEPACPECLRAHREDVKFHRPSRAMSTVQSTGHACIEHASARGTMTGVADATTPPVATNEQTASTRDKASR